MALKYTPAKDALICPEPSLTEQEHKDSCDINIMIRNAKRGMQIRGGKTPQYGFDDTTMDSVQYRMKKDKLERELDKQFRENEFTEQEIEQFPPSVQKKYAGKIKLKKRENEKPNNEDAIQKDPPANNPNPNPPTPSNQPPEPKKPA